jgi:hypothetical protein
VTSVNGVLPSFYSRSHSQGNGGSVMLVAFADRVHNKWLVTSDYSMNASEHVGAVRVPRA